AQPSRQETRHRAGPRLAALLAACRDRRNARGLLRYSWTVVVAAARSRQFTALSKGAPPMKASRLAMRLAAAITLALAGAAGVSHAGGADDAPGLLSSGAIELTPNVSFNHSSTKREGYGNVDTFTRFDFTPTVGFCLTDRFEA